MIQLIFKSRIRPINQKLLNLLGIFSEDIENDADKALDIIESPWERRDEKDLREWFSSEYETKENFIIKTY